MIEQSEAMSVKKKSLVVQLILHMFYKQLELDNVICHPIKLKRPEIHRLAL